MANEIGKFKGRVWDVLFAAVPSGLRGAVVVVIVLYVVTGELFGPVSNFRGATSGACSVSLFKAACSWVGITPDDGTDVPALKAIVGNWSLPASSGKPACRNPLVYSVEKRGDDRVVHVSTSGFDSVARIVDVQDMSIFTRTTSPPSDAGHPWTLRLENDRLEQVDDANNTSTTLVRCGGG